MQTRRPLFVSGSENQQPKVGTLNANELLRGAVSNRDHPLAENLLQGGADPNFNDGRLVPLVIASWNDDLQMVQLLLKYNARADLPSPDSNYPSLLAACFTPKLSVDVVKVLRLAGAVDVEGTQPQHRTLAQQAQQFGRADILALL